MPESFVIAYFARDLTKKLQDSPSGVTGCLRFHGHHCSDEVKHPTVTLHNCASGSRFFAPLPLALKQRNVNPDSCHHCRPSPVCLLCSLVVCTDTVALTFSCLNPIQPLPGPLL